jgi:peptidoglycan/xylan/chitin deacetylase (PgdA/CDA1 family)
MTGVFTLTLDTELIWGSFDHASPAEFERQYPDERATVDGMLRLLERYEVPATWAVIGHLFLSECSRDASGRAHGDMVHPRQSAFEHDWYSQDPCTDVRRDPLWYGPDMIDAISDAAHPQEIACHSFAHAQFGDPAMTIEAARSDLAACVRLAAERGITLKSFVFPRNSEGHHAAVHEAGFRVFRGVDPTWHSRTPDPVRRVAHLADQAMGIAPPVSKPVEQLPGLWNVPGSALLLGTTGVRRYIPAASRIHKAKLGIQRAAEQDGVFHLWTHPFNLSTHRAYMLGVLEGILRVAAGARDRDQIRIAPMKAVPDLFGARPEGSIVDRAAKAVAPGQDLAPAGGSQS